MFRNNMNTKILTYAYIRQNHNQTNNICSEYMYPKELQELISQFTEKIFKSKILTHSMDLVLLITLNETLKLSVINEPKKIYTKSVLQEKSIFLNQNNTFTLFQTNNDDIFGIFIYGSWNKVLKNDYDIFGKLYFFNKNRKKIQIRNSNDFSTKLKQNIPYPISSFILNKNMKEIEVFHLLNYNPYEHCKSSTPGVTPESETDYDSDYDPYAPGFYIF